MRAPSPISFAGDGNVAELAALVEGPLVRASWVADVAIVVVTHESAAVIDECLESIRSVGSHKAQVVVVDNMSSDGTAEIVAARHPEVTLVRKRRRSGYATNCNVGVAVTRARHVLLLNPDTVVLGDAVDTLIRYLDAHPEVGVAAPRLVYRDGTPQPSARRFPTVATVLIRRTPLRRLFPNSNLEQRFLHGVDAADHGTAPDIDWALGAALAVRSEAWADLEGLDGGFRLYCEDADLCWRAHLVGWAVRYLPDAVIAHDLGEHTRKHFFTIRTVWHLRGMLRFARKHGLKPPVGSPSGQGTGR